MYSVYEVHRGVQQCRRPSYCHSALTHCLAQSSIHPGKVHSWYVLYTDVPSENFLYHIFTVTFPYLDTQVFTIVLRLPTVSNTVTCCPGLQPRSNRLYLLAVWSRLHHLGLCKCTTERLRMQSLQHMPLPR